MGALLNYTKVEDANLCLFGKKICVVTNQYCDAWTGVARSARRLVAYLKDAGATIHVVTPLSERKVIESNGGLHHKLALENPEVGASGELIYKVFLGNSSVEMSELHEFITILDFKEQFDCFHGFWLPYAYGCLIASSIGRRPVIASIRGNDAVAGLGQVKRMPFIQAVLKRATHITSVSSDLLENVSIFENLEGRSSVIHNGIEHSEFEKWNIGAAKRGSVGTLGELRYKKGIPYLVDAFSLIEKNLKTHLLLAGDFTDTAEAEIVQQLVINNNLSGFVKYMGQLKRNRICSYINSLNVFVLSSLHDGFPNTLLEACACGVPIVATNVGGMKDVMKDGENCLLVKAGDAKAMSHAISRILRDDELALKLSNGAKEIASKFNLERESESWISLYQRLMEFEIEN
ncbi:glycosyltransferase family 4 protein [Cellvibrio sp. NN19]|uniref:glycosyltransferase family 4 protein n=1 Tax=Cellvibrio chitinivorans TaxID=3102792 RepID=UPI002B40BEB1|nr:glycosyltransferase family 4 protein [Cellvibrio sp. NN19]